jgi:hypothetical protein
VGSIVPGPTMMLGVSTLSDGEQRVVAAGVSPLSAN